MTKEEFKMFLDAVIKIRSNASDEHALESKDLYPLWKSGINYTAEKDRVRYNDSLYKCSQSHTSQDDWTPDVTASLWTPISLEEGTLESPITAVRGMEYIENKYYLDPENGVIYRCTRSGTLHYLPHELVGAYFE